MYGLSLDELIEFDIAVKEIQKMIDETSDSVSDKIDWTSVWGKKYPVLTTYQNTVEMQKYAAELNKLLDNLQKEYEYSKLDAFLVLKDILATVWKSA